MTDAYDVTLDRTPRRVVVKLYRDGDGTAPLEWSRLEFAQRVALPQPDAALLHVIDRVNGGTRKKLYEAHFHPAQ